MLGLCGVVPGIEGELWERAAASVFCGRGGKEGEEAG